MNVVLYMRYSSNNQTEQSIEGQERVCTEYCKRNGYTIVNKYIDRATSALKDVDKRTEFLRMIKDSEKHLWEAVVVYKLDRFARNRYDSATFKAKLKRNGVKVISATENISDNPEGIILESVLEGMAEFYSRELSQKISRGIRESAYKCHNIGGFVPLGYKVENKKLVIDPATANIVREAFDLYVNGMAIKDICELFNQKGYRSIKGAKFNKNSFNKIFKNEKYIGVYQCMDVRIEGGVPAIIDKDTFEKAQRRRASNAHAPAKSKAKVQYLLSGKLICGHCNTLMVGESGVSHTGKAHYYYTCATRKKKQACDKKAIKKDIIERFVTESAMKVLTPETIDRIAEAAIEQNRKDIANDTTISSLTAQINNTEKSIANLLKLAEKVQSSDSLANRLQELEEQKRALTIQLVDAQSNYIELEKDHIVWWLSQFTEGNIDDPDYRRQIIDLLVHSVTVYDSPDGFKVTLTLNLVSKGSAGTLESSDLLFNTSFKTTYPNLYFCDTLVGYTIEFQRE